MSLHSSSKSSIILLFFFHLSFIFWPRYDNKSVLTCQGKTVFCCRLRTNSDLRSIKHIKELNISPKIDTEELNILQSLHCKVDKTKLQLHNFNTGATLALTQTYKNDRGRKGGGVAIFVRNNMVITRKEDLEELVFSDNCIKISYGFCCLKKMDIAVSKSRSNFINRWLEYRFFAIQSYYCQM